MPVSLLRSSEPGPWTPTQALRTVSMVLLMAAVTADGLEPNQRRGQANCSRGRNKLRTKRGDEVRAMGMPAVLSEGVLGFQL